MVDGFIFWQFFEIVGECFVRLMSLVDILSSFCYLFRWVNCIDWWYM